MDDIAIRLRSHATEGVTSSDRYVLRNEAAAEIDRLRSEIERLSRQTGPIGGTYDLKDMETFCALAASKMYEACLFAVQGERLSGETGHPDDELYNRAVRDCENAIIALTAPLATTGGNNQKCGRCGGPLDKETCWRCAQGER